MGYQNLKKLDNGQSRVLNSQVPYYFAYSFVSVMLYRNGFEHKTDLRMSPLQWDISKPIKMFIAREIMHEGSIRFKVIILFIISNSLNLVHHISYAYTLAP